MLSKQCLTYIFIFLLPCCALRAQHASALEYAIPTDEISDIWNEANQSFERGTYGHAKLKFEAFLKRCDERNDLTWKSEVLKAKVYRRLCAFHMGEEQAEHALLQLYQEYRPEPIIYDAALEAGNYWYDQNKYREAIAWYERIDLTQASGNLHAETAFKMGYCYFVRKDFTRAGTFLSQSSNYRTVYYYPSVYYLGMTSFFKQDYDRAAEYFEQVAPSRLYKSYIPYYLTQIYFNQKDFEKTVKYAEEQLELNEELERKAEIINILGRSFFELGDDEKALTYLRQFKSMDVEFTAADHYQLGYLAYKDSSYSEAIFHLKQISALDNEIGIKSNYYMAHAFLSTNQKESARSAFANVRRRSTDENLKQEANYNFGLLSAELKYDREAVNALKDIGPSSAYYQNAQKALAQLFLKTRDYDNAIEILNSLELNTPLLKEAYQKVTYSKGRQELAKPNFQTAVDWFDKSLQFPIDNNILEETHFSKGFALHYLGNYEQSTTSLIAYETLEEDSDSENKSISEYILAFNYLKQEKYSEAEKHLDNCISILTRNTQTPSESDMGLLADAYVRSGDCDFYFNRYADALSNYRKAFEMQKGSFIYAYYQMGIIYGLQNDPIQKIVILEDLQAKYPNSAIGDDALLEAGKTYLSLQKYDAASSPLLQLVEYYPQTEKITEVYLLLGLISYNKGAMSQAAEFYRKVFQFNPSTIERQDGIRALEEIYIRELREPDSFVEFMEEISGGKISVNVRDSFQYKTAYASFTSGNYEDAEEDFTTYLNNYPKGIHSIEAHYFRGETRSYLENYSDAYADYIAVVDRQNSSYYKKSLQKAALIAYNDIEDFRTALNHYQTLLSMQLPGTEKVNATIGALRCAQRLDMDDLIITLAGSLVSMPGASDTDRLMADYFLAFSLYKTGDFDRALDALNRVSKRSQDVKAAEARYLIADIYYQRKEYNIAEEMCRLAIQANTNYPIWVAKSLILLSDLLVAQGDAFNAKAALEAIIENFTEDKEIIDQAQQRLNAIQAAEEDSSEIIKNANSDLLELDDN